MKTEITAFQIDLQDNVATVLAEVKADEPVKLIGGREEEIVAAATDIPTGHKIALQDIGSGEKIIKYGVAIGRATANIPKGSWVHLHVIQSIYDERSGHLDVKTGAPKDTRYE
ncbi:UxaA family hydrolase [Lacrimispora sp.]|uniref:UxaA family hydrolase n=1 Tax=Lacrimispora sp. TaxID=2719234 RepID=UPI0034607D70